MLNVIKSCSSARRRLVDKKGDGKGENGGSYYGIRHGLCNAMMSTFTR